ncbi:ATP-binding cassette domain-containing protein [Cognatishimia sp. D5M38]|uniref:ATP-binding cassette domain-containing protein n=1 Tax=Cognatishimia coralii TaxID=3083254 RepID=A0ABU8QFZ1_9RHOB
MQHSRALTDEVGVEEKGEVISKDDLVPLKVSDRSFPPWAFTLGALFTIAHQVCCYALALLAVFFVTTVVQQGEVGMAPILTGIGAVFMLCLVVVNFAHTRALSGYRNLREEHADRISAGLSGVIFLALCVVHPLAGGAILVGCTVGLLAHILVSRLARMEPFWEILPGEAVSLLSGRDRIGVKLASAAPDQHAMATPINIATLGIAVTFAFALGSYLIAENILNEVALYPLVLASVWSVENALRFFTRTFSNIPTKVLEPAEVIGNLQDPEEEEFGLSVKNLTVLGDGGTQLLSNLTFEAPPGSITGIIGESGSGKSLLLQSLADPYALMGMEVSGQIRFNSSDIWLRSAKARDAALVYLPDHPILLPISGAANLSCYDSEDSLRRGKALLERLVFSSEIVDSICDSSDATHLPRSQAQALAFARAFLISPELYLFDRPEDGLTEKQIAGVVERVKQEVKLGRSVVMATDNRALLETCDRLVVMQYGRIIDQGPAELVRDRISTGWSRFIGARQLDTEENLTRWIHSHFRRGPEEANKRRVTTVATDMLTYSCKTADPGWPGLITFSFKHFEGHCVLRMEDQDAPITSAQFERARQAAKESTISKDILPLASIFQSSIEVEKSSNIDHRVLEVKIKTFDPRRVKAGAKDGAKPNP